MTQQHAIDPQRLATIQTMDLQSGGHDDISSGMCVMEAVSYVAGEPWSDTPECACPVISTFLRSWNDALPDDERNSLLRDLIPQIVGTRSTPEIEQRRATMAADWLIRTHTPAWLRLAKRSRRLMRAQGTIFFGTAYRAHRARTMRPVRLPRDRYCDPLAAMADHDFQAAVRAFAPIGALLDSLGRKAA